jgi:hypothetical protein
MTHVLRALLLGLAVALPPVVLSAQPNAANTTPIRLDAAVADSFARAAGPPAAHGGRPAHHDRAQH